MNQSDLTAEQQDIAKKFVNLLDGATAYIDTSDDESESDSCSDREEIHTITKENAKSALEAILITQIDDLGTAIVESIENSIESDTGFSVSTININLDELVGLAASLAKKANRYKCPTCGNSDKLDVVVTVWARLIQTADEIETDISESQDQTTEWDNSSSMHCTQCGLIGKAHHFNSWK